MILGDPFHFLRARRRLQAERRGSCPFGFLVNTNPKTGLGVAIEIKQEGLAPQVLVPMFPLSDRVPFWNSGFLNHSHMKNRQREKEDVSMFVGLFARTLWFPFASLVHMAVGQHQWDPILVGR